MKLIRLPFLRLVILATIALIFLRPVQLKAQATCKGAQFEEIGQGPIRLGSGFRWSGFIAAGADFDGDSLADIVTTAFNNSNYYINLVLLRNISTGKSPSKMKFDTAITILDSIITWGNPIDIVVNDFNNDGKPDIAMLGNYYSSGEVTILLNNSTKGAIKFIIEPSVVLPVSCTKPSLKTSDFNHDGIQDLMYAGSDGKLYILAVFKIKSGFKDSIIYTGIQMKQGRNSASYFSYDVADVNNDSLPDVAYALQNLDTVFVFQNTSTKDSIKFKLALSVKTPDSMATSQFWEGRHLQLKDLDADGKPDLSILYGPDKGSYTSYYGDQKMIFYKNASSKTSIAFAFEDTINLNRYIGSSYGYKVNDTGAAMSGDKGITFTGFALVNDGGANLKPDLVLCTEGVNWQYSVNSYFVNTSDSGKIKFSNPCWFKRAVSDWIFTGDFNNDGADEIVSYCDACLRDSSGKPIDGMSMFTNGSNANEIEEIASGSTTIYKIIPNPASDNVHTASNQYFKSIDIMDAIGNVVKRLNTAETRTLDVSLNGLSAGLYYFRIQGASDVAVKKVIKVN